MRFVLTDAEYGEDNVKAVKQCLEDSYQI